MIRKENWLREPKNRETQGESERMSKAKSKMFVEGKDCEQLQWKKRHKRADMNRTKTLLAFYTLKI